MAADESLVRLRKGDAGFFLFVTGLAAAGAAYFAGRGLAAGVVGCGLIALLTASAPFLLAGEAFCPHCEGALLGVPLLAWLKDYERCTTCRRYLRREGAALRAIDEGHLAARPEFSIPVDAVRELPQLCCQCRRPANRFQDLVYTAAVRHSPGFPTGKSVSFKVAAPYCEEHLDAAVLVFEDLAGFPGIGLKMFLEPDEPQHHFVLKVRSYGFYRAALGV
ncbi:MAG: hypothetical protein SF051_14185 [Elusimicrobiota bacterium]|nr:hypothetical protein [Elusimicrobiota bacterium]